MTTLRMPDLGTVEGSVTLVRWLKREGDAVALGEPLFEVETDKGVSQVECAAEGTLVSWLVAEGATVAAGDSIATIRGHGESEHAAPSVRGAEPRAPLSAPRGPAPVITALAAKHGVNLGSVKGTGPGGTITRQDVLEAQEPPHVPPAAPTSSPAGSPLQSIVAARMTQSHREKPVFHITAKVDMSRLISSRGSLRFDAFFVKACADALVEFPAFRAYRMGDHAGRHQSLDIGVAIAVGDDLYAPAVRNPAGKGVREIAADIDGLVARAKEPALTAPESEGTCFLVTNLGMYPVESFDAVILPEHSAALAAGAAIPTPFSAGVGVHVAPLAALTLSVDHRLINGDAAARFLTRVKQLLEDGGWT
jgi:pyruvate dehydrogenase E2 component (dihydrolipoamide acetyltransferase)